MTAGPPRTFDIVVATKNVRVEDRKVVQDDGELTTAIGEVLHEARLQSPNRQIGPFRINVDEVF